MIRRIRRQEEQLHPAARRFDESFDLSCPMCGTSIGDQKDLARFSYSNRLRNSIKTSAFTPPLALIMNRMRPFEVIAEIRLMA
jgi:hypothetical protein